MICVNLSLPKIQPASMLKMTNRMDNKLGYKLVKSAYNSLQ